MQLQQHLLRALQNLEHNIGKLDVLAFNGILRQFMSQLSLANIEQFSCFHSVTTLFEFFTTYLTLQSCWSAVLIPQSWIDIHLARFAHTGQSLFAREVPDLDRRLYASGLLELTMCFCELLSRLTWLPGSNFRLGKSHYPSRLLHLRNTELLGLAIVNLGINHSEMNLFKEVRDRVRQVHKIPLPVLVRAAHFSLGLLIFPH